MKMPRIEVDSSRRSAWAFTRLRHTGYPQYLWNVDEVNCPRFLCVCIQTIMITKIYDYEETITFSCDHFATHGGMCL